MDKAVGKTDEKSLAKRLVEEIRRMVEQRGMPLRFMEVCGTHTVAIFRSGLRQLLPEEVELVSGPGCPVCVTPVAYIDQALGYAKETDTIITTFGDMMKVPGSSSSLAEAHAAGADIRIVYSPLDSLAIAEENPGKRVIFLSVGFETTTPSEASTIVTARRKGQKNFFMLSAQKLVPAAIRMLLEDPETQVDGFLLPGHVAVITGTAVFDFLPREYGRPGVVAGFEPLEILRAVYRLARMTTEGKPSIINEYGRVVRSDGNPVARKIVEEVYEQTDTEWRGLGMIPHSGLVMRPAWNDFDIAVVEPQQYRETKKVSACRCGEVLRGRITPEGCPLFGQACRPEQAAGPCMVSVEGVCAAWYKYGGSRFRYGK